MNYVVSPYMDVSSGVCSMCFFSDEISDNKKEIKWKSEIKKNYIHCTNPVTIASRVFILLYHTVTHWSIPRVSQSTVTHLILLPPSHNTRDFKFLLVMFDHLSYLIFFEIIIYFICYLFYYLQYFKHNFLVFIFVKKN